MAIYDPTLVLDRDKIRFLVGDTDDNNQMLGDDEIAFVLLNQGNNLYATSADLCETLAARFARDVNYRFSTLWQDAGDAFDHFIQLADKYRIAAVSNDTAPVFTHGESIDPDLQPEQIWIGMHDNPPVDKEPV